MTPTPYRCAAASREADEPSAGTASTVREFLLVECAGPWGVDALRDSRLPSHVKEHLRDLQEREGVRALLVRRCGGTTPGGAIQVYRADVATGALTGGTVAVVDEVVDLDRHALDPVEGPLFLACTHGRHDACCAELGRPLAQALALADPVRTWEVTHIGGDRFAPNVLVLPHGLYYGRLRPDDAAAFVAGHLEGRLDLDHLRGRTTYPFAVQAAEIHLRRELGEDRLDAVRLQRTGRAGADRVADFEVARPDGSLARWRVRVGARTLEPALLTCRAPQSSVAVSHELREAHELTG